MVFKFTVGTRPTIPSAISKPLKNVVLKFSTNVPKPKKGIFDVSIINHRERVAKVEPMLNPANVSFFDMLTPISDTVRIPTRVYVPPEEEGPFPTLFYIPGTAFVAHESKFTRVISSHICRIAQCQVIVINHRLAPENPMSVLHLDSYEVLKFFLQRRSNQFLIDKDKVVLAGYSSGGNIAASMAIKAKQDKIPIAQQILISPIVDLSRSLKDYSQYEKQDSDISEEFVNWFLDLSLSENINPKDPEISPIWANKEKLKGLPPTTIVLAEYDRFRSDAELYYKKLLKAGVNVKKLFLDKENHTYLWHKLEIVEKIARDILKPVFDNHQTQRHQLQYVKPIVYGFSKPQKQEDSNVENPARSKLYR